MKEKLNLTCNCGGKLKLINKTYREKIEESTFILKNSKLLECEKCKTLFFSPLQKQAINLFIKIANNGFDYLNIREKTHESDFELLFQTLKK